LLDKEGYIKIVDFGFAKICNEMTYTLCGTPDYLAPEVIMGQGHAKGVDWWTLGVLIFEMLASYPPFYDEDPMETYKKILSGQVEYPRHFSKEVIDLLSKLLHPKSTKRYGVIKGGAALIKNHPWFAGFDWDALDAKKIKGPYLPEVHDVDDLHNFAALAEEELEFDFPPYVDDGTGWDKEF
jgi:protein kinase A